MRSVQAMVEIIFGVEAVLTKCMEALGLIPEDAADGEVDQLFLKVTNIL